MLRHAKVTRISSKYQHPVILFDGVCNLCARSVQLVIRNDRDSLFRFASLQSDVAQDLLQEFEFQHNGLSSMLLIMDGRLYRKSRAALTIARHMDKLWPSLYYLLVWIPRFITDPVYDFIGSRRYRWFGKKESCWIPDDKLLARFLPGGIPE